MSQRAEKLLIRVYGDSLSMPRHQDGVGYFDTYPELLRDEIESSHPGIRVAVFNRARGGTPITEIHEQFLQDSAYLEDDGVRILIIQCGIVDCAPRPVPPTVKGWISRLPAPLRLLTVKGLHHARPFILRAGLKWRSTRIEVFESVLTRWVQNAAGGMGQTYVINIAPTIPAIEAHSPGLEPSVRAYNAAISRVLAANPSVAILIDVHAEISRAAQGPSLYINQTDGHHITPSGHRLYADMIYSHEKKRLEH